MRYMALKLDSGRARCWYVLDTLSKCVVAFDCYEAVAKADSAYLNDNADPDVHHVKGFLYVMHYSPYRRMPDEPIPFSRFLEMSNA